MDLYFPTDNSTMALVWGGQLAALYLVSRGSYTHIEVCVFYIRLLQLNSIICFRVRGKHGGDARVSALI